MTKILTPDAQFERDQFEREFGHSGNCSCHISAPCCSCTHPGNPANQEADDDCWMPETHTTESAYQPYVLNLNGGQVNFDGMKCYALVLFDDGATVVIEFENLIHVLPGRAGGYVVEHVLMTPTQFKALPELQG